MTNHKRVRADFKSKIKFVKKVHKYYKNDIEYISATTLKKKFVKPFDADFWSLYIAIREYLDIEKEKFSNYLKTKYGVYIKHADVNTLETVAGLINGEIFNNVPKILQRWEDYKNERGRLGSEFHDKKEKEAYIKGFGTIGDSTGDIVTYYSYNLGDLRDGYYAELLVYLDYAFDKDNNLYDAGVAGQVDKCLITTDSNGDRWIDIDDYKTCAEISTDAYDKMLYPFNELDHNDVNEFAIQLNIYAYILNQWGYKTRSLRFTHCMIDPETREQVGEKVYHLPVFPHLIEKAIKYYRKDNPIIKKKIMLYEQICK